MAATTEFELPLAKRQKVEDQVTLRQDGSRVFAPFRTVGLVSPTRVPFTSVPLGKTTFQITTSVGRSLQTYDLRRGLSLVFLSRPQCPEAITATCAYRDRVFAAWGGGNAGTQRGIWVVKRGRVIDQLEFESTTEQEIEQILVFGAWIVACGPHAIEVWKNETYEHYTTIRPATRSESTANRLLSGCLCTLPTFLNKIFVGRQDGGIDIYNVSTAKLVYSVAPPSPNSGRVTAMSPAPSLALVGVAYTDGSILILDAEVDEVVMQFHTSHTGQPVTSIAFRTDGAGAGDDGQQDGVMATASSASGDITMWDLNRGGKMVGVLRGAHDLSDTLTGSGITKIEFLPGQPVIISTGLDNSLKSWIFDQVPFSTVPRPLHTRSGHAASITNLRFLPAASDGSEAAGKWLLSAGQDRSLWGFSLRKDGQSTELSQGNVRSKAKKAGKLDSTTVEDSKAAPITAMACSLNRDGGMGAVGGAVWMNAKSTNAEESGMTGWESVVTAHQNDRFARTWFWGRKKAGRWIFESGDREPVTSVAITTCGTFAIVGSAGGSIDMFNLQSGMHRQRFPPKLKPAEAKRLKLQQLESDEPIQVQRGHRDGITGLVVDSLNRTMVSTSLDGDILFWDFATGNLLHRMSFSTGAPTAIQYNPVSGLVSMACDDLCIRIVDIETKRVVRELWGCVGQILDHCFSHDGRWIVACSMDSVIRLFDLATGHLIDAFKTATCTNLACSSTGEFLATAHAGQIGINIWNNKSLFANIPIRQIDEDTGVIDLTTVSTFDAVSQLAAQDENATDQVDFDSLNLQSTIDQLDAELLTLSLVPRSRWQTLLNLETIRARNKPIAPPEKPKAAPFFLGSSNLTNGDQQQQQQIAGVDNVSDSQALTPITEQERSRISRLTELTSTTSSSQDITPLLTTYSQTSDPSQLSKHLATLPPSSTDLLLRTMSLSELPLFISALTARLRQRRDFELVNTWMSLVLRIHGEFVSQVPEVQKEVVLFRDVMDQETTRLEGLVGWCRGVGEFLRSSR